MPAGTDGSVPTCRCRCVVFGNPFCSDQWPLVIRSPLYEVCCSCGRAGSFVKLIGWCLLLQGQALSQLKTLPQILLPTRFSLIKALVRHGRGLQVPPPSPRARARAETAFIPSFHYVAPDGLENSNRK